MGISELVFDSALSREELVLQAHTILSPLLRRCVSDIRKYNAGTRSFWLLWNTSQWHFSKKTPTTTFAGPSMWSLGQTTYFKKYKNTKQ
jgi:hypothetical protein